MPRFLAIACAVCACAAAPVAAQTHVVVTASRANVRSGPSTSSAVVGTVVQGTRLRVVRALRGWYEVQDNTGSAGWYVASSVVRAVQVAPEETPAPPPPLPRDEPPAPRDETPRDAPIELPPAGPQRTAARAAASTAPRYRLYAALVPWAVRTEASSVVLTRAADLSNFPSTVLFEEANQTRGFSAGGTVRFAPMGTGRVRLVPEAGLAFTGGGGLRELQAIGGASAILGRGSVQPAVGVHAGLGYAWGVIGEVGAVDPRDTVLEPPSGGSYPVGSKIVVDALTLGIEPAASVSIPVAGRALLVEGGYRFGLQLGDWTYAVEHVNDSSDRTELPSAGFSNIEPPELRRSGLFVRLGFAF